MSDAVWIAVERATSLRALDGLARERGWKLAVDHVRTHVTGSQRLWAVREGVRAGRADEHTLGVAAVVVEGDAALADELRRSLPGVIGHDELLRRAAGDALPGALDALRALAVVTPRERLGELAPLLERWSRHPSEGVRRAVLRLVARTGEAALAVAAARRDDPELGEVYGRLHEALTKPKGGGKKR